MRNFQLNHLALNEHGEGLARKVSDLISSSWVGTQLIVDGCLMVWAKQHPALEPLVKDGLLVDVENFPTLKGTLPTSRHYYVQQV